VSQLLKSITNSEFSKYESNILILEVGFDGMWGCQRLKLNVSTVVTEIQISDFNQVRYVSVCCLQWSRDGYICSSIPWSGKCQK
jgi:hypothetical protein